VASAVVCVVAWLFVAMTGPEQKAAEKTYVLKAARLFDGKSDALVSPGLVVVSGGKIVGVGSAATIPSGAEVLDLGDATLLPGWIDAHTHLTIPYAEDYNRTQLDNLRKTIPEKALDASVNARVTLMAGITTVRDVGSRDFLDVGLRNAIAKGDVPGRACW
jgi:imidazolonepropionase-like amidohydrolase